MSNERQDLIQNMRLRADADGLAKDHPLRTLAMDLEAAIAGFFSAPQTVPVQKFVGAWARARKAWCAHTGDSLL